ncbi:MAG TPA: PAS domain S-box protein [Solirubrobacteraceae bacterium]|nr:PAS domain S-box protein [Solirubrobacteraceae bacterium]
MTHASAASTPPASVPRAAAGTPADRLWATTHDLLATADADRRLTATNPAWETLLGWTADELHAGSYDRLVHPDDVERIAALERDVLAACAGERPDTELRLRARDGSYRWFAFSAACSEPDELAFCGKDVTARKQREEELRAADERFRAVTASTRDGIVSADGNGRIIFWNAGAEGIFGHTSAEIVGRPLTHLMPERYRDAHRAGIARFLETGEGRLTGSTVEVEGLRADGTEFPVELSLGSWSHNGQTCFTGVVRDMSDRVRARQALREAEERFAGAFEGAAVGLMLAAPDGTVLRANRALCELTGWPEEELVGRRFDELLHPDERGADDAALAAMLGGRTRRLAAERRFLVADGGTRFVRINLSLIRTPDDAPLHFVGQIEDVTGRRRMIEALTISEARYKGLIAHLPDSTVHLFDHDLRLLVSEGNRMHGHGYDPQALEGQLLEEVVPPAAYERLAPEYRAALAGETRSFDLDSLDGSATYWVQVAPLRDDVGHIIGGMAISRDITARRHGELALQQRAGELERSNAELEQFAYVASHDLSEPLRMVSSYLQLLRRRYHGRLDADADQFIDFAVDGAGRMRDLIDDLLTYSRAGRSGEPLGPVDSRAVVERVVEALRTVEDAREARIVVGDLPTVLGDRHQLGQLFQNVIGNAVKFVPDDRMPEIEVSAVRAGERWCFEVADNGIGLEPAHAERIFRMFQRLHTRDEYPGTGIGLAIAKKVVERHGGTIWAEPSPEGGSRFRFTLPKAPA